MRETGLVEESLDFGAGEMLTYRLQSRLAEGPVEAAFRQGLMTVFVSQQAANDWAGSDKVGLYGQSGPLTISIEKDFRCLTRRLDDHERDAYPHPG